MSQSRLFVFADGTPIPTKGGSGFRNLVESSRIGRLHADIVGVASIYDKGGVWQRAQELDILFYHLERPYTAETYRAPVRETRADFVALSGCFKKVQGLDRRTTVNIHPGPPEFSGPGMYSHHVHEAVMAAFHRGEITHTALFMHFVTEEYDQGPPIFRCNIPIRDDDTPDTLGTRVNKWEHRFQPQILDLVVTRQITWSGSPGERPVFPTGYEPIIWVE